MPDERFSRGFFLRRVFESLLGRHRIVLVLFMDHPKLQMPVSVRPKGDRTATFEYGLDLPVQIPDLKITDEGIGATLSFGRMPRATFVPWEAVIQVGLPYQGTAPKPELVAKKDENRPSLKLVP